MTCSLYSSFDYDLPLLAQLPLVREAGFRHICIGGQHTVALDQTRARELDRALRAEGLTVEAVHGPACDHDDSLEQLAHAVEVAQVLGCRTVICHASSFRILPEEYPRLLARVVNMFQTLSTRLAAIPVRIAIENLMPDAATELALAALQELAPDRFGFCYDSAHDQIDGPRCFDLLSRCGSRLCCVHLSDRLGPHRDHVVPGDGFIDWPGLIRNLRATGYRGPLAFEVMKLHSGADDDRELLRRVRKAADWLSDLFGEASRQEAAPP